MEQEPQTLIYHFKAIWNIFSESLRKKEPAEAIITDPITSVNFRLLTESPTLDTNNLRFGHEQIIGALRKIILASGSSMTIGLFGGWGTGKSSIVENLKASLFAEKTPVVIFDVWKHDGDALRRTFLKDMDIQLSATPYGESYVNAQNILSPQVFNAVKDSSEKISIKTKRFFINLFILFLIAAVVIGAILISCLLFQKLTGVAIFDLLMQSKTVSGVGVLLTTGLTGGLVFKYIDNFIKVEKTESQKEKLQDPHEFETEFHRLVNNLKANIPTLVVVFDNLDRVSGDNVLKVISTIKTFLDFRSVDDKKKVIFLIPCDENAIKLHIQFSLNNEDPLYVDEFLRKFFNTSLWIPEFYENELEDFATEKLKETGVEDFQNERLAWFVIRAFHKNPRQIVQFINILLSNYLLMKEFCEKGAFENKTFYKTNLLQLAKFLALKMCFPEIIDLYQRKGVYAIDNDDIKREITKEENGYVDHKEFQDLLERTREISIASLETYFRFRLSKDEQLIPELSNILNEIIYENGKVKLSEEVVKNLNIPALSNAIRNKFRSSTNRHIQFSIFKGTLTFAQKFKVTLTDNLYKDLLDLMMRMLKSDHLTFDPELLRENLLLKINPLPTADLQKIIDNYLSPLGAKDNKLSDEYIEKTLNFLIAFRKSFTTPQLTTISNILVQQYLNDKIIYKMLQDDEAQKKFVDSKFREHLITQLTKAVVADRLHVYSLLPLVVFEDNYVPTVLNAVAQSFPNIWTSFQSDESKAGMLIHLTEQTLSKLLNEDRSDAIASLITLITDFQRQPNNIQFLPIVMQLNRQKGLEEEVQTYFTSVINPAQRSELTQLIEHADINSSFDTLTLEHLFTRLVLFEKPSELIMPALDGQNQLLYIQFLLKNGHYDALAKAWLLLPELSIEQETLIVDQIVIQAKSKHNSIKLDELQILLQIIGLSGHNHPLPINDDLIGLIMTLISREPSSELFNTGIKFLEKYTQLQGAHIQMLGDALIETAYQLNYSTIKKLYERLFALFGVLTEDDKNRLRDLIYIHLLHHLNGDIANLETAIYATEFAGEFDFHGCEKYFEDFIAIADNFKDSEVSSYYEKLIKILLQKLKKYQSALFKDIKRRLKAQVETDKK